MEDLIKQRKRMNPVRMELSRELDKKTVSSLCKDIHVEKEHVFLSHVPLDMSFVFCNSELSEKYRSGESFLPEKNSENDAAAG